MKHLFKRTVVLLNDFASIDNLLQKAIDFSRQHQTSLEVLYVHEDPLFDVPDYFLSEDKITNEQLDKSKIKKKIEEHLVALGESDDHAILVYEDDTVDQVIHYGNAQKDLLFITAYHANISDNLVSKTPHSFWIIKHGGSEYQKIALPIDFTQKGEAVLQASKHIFDAKRITMVHDYRYLLDTLSVPIDYLDVSPMVSPDIFEINEELRAEKREQFEAYKKEFEVEGECIDAEGSLDQDLMDYISKKEFDLVIMYHQENELFLSPSLIVLLLNALSCDFFIFNP